MKHKKFWTLDKQGNEVLRDLDEESKNFDIVRFWQGEFDANLFVWHEMFNYYIYDDIGCDYERYGCKIMEGDVVVDIGANIGIFAHRAETRGASRVICFEPVIPNFSCLLKNKGEKTEVYNLGIGDKTELREFSMHTDFSANISATDREYEYKDKNIIYTQNCYLININEIFSNFSEKIDFMKMDIEGGEVVCLNAISDENLKKLRCFAAEFHGGFESFQIFQDNFLSRMDNLGFNHFVLYHGDGNLRTINCWKR